MNAVYFDQTGRVTKAIEASAEIIALNKSPDEDYIEAYLEGNPRDYKIVDGQLTKKPALPLTVSGNVISNIPVNSTVTIGTQPPVIVSDGIVTLSAQYAQQVLVTVEHPDYLPSFLKVNV